MAQNTVYLGELQEIETQINLAKQAIEDKAEAFKALNRTINTQETALATLTQTINGLQTEFDQKQKRKQDLERRFKDAYYKAAEDAYYKAAADAIFKDLQQARQEFEAIKSKLSAARKRHQQSASALKTMNETTCPAHYKALEQAYRTRAAKQFDDLKLRMKGERLIEVEATRNCDESPRKCRKILETQLMEKAIKQATATHHSTDSEGNLIQISKDDVTTRNPDYSKAVSINNGDGYRQSLRVRVLATPPQSYLNFRTNQALNEFKQTGLTCKHVEIATILSPLPNSTSEKELKECDTCPQMVLIPSGSFMMGSNDGGSDEKPVHRVKIDYEFYMGRYEVTRGQFAQFVNDTGYKMGNKCWTFENEEIKNRSNRHWRNPGFSQNDDHPLVCVSWDDATAYIAWLNKKLNLSGKYAYRLPSEAEWEYAARAGTTTKYSFGNDEGDLCSYANGADKSTNFDWRNKKCSDGYGEKTAPVGSFKPNPFDLYDMHGNVWEWVEDCWNDTYRNAPNDGRAWTSGDCQRRVLRGGSWDSSPFYLRSADRDWNYTGNRVSGYGFRLSRTAPP